MPGVIMDELTSHLDLLTKLYVRERSSNILCRYFAEQNWVNLLIWFTSGEKRRRPASVTLRHSWILLDANHCSFSSLIALGGTAYSLKIFILGQDGKSGASWKLPL